MRGAAGAPTHGDAGDTIGPRRRDFVDFVHRVDVANALFYLDPPYWGNEGDCGKALFSRDRFEEMAQVLRAIKGRFIRPLNNRSEVRETFAGLTFTKIRTTYSIASNGTGVPMT